ncbi:MAG: hypothetical protein JW795_15995 [Chitinivibrionales bacterium]|nr:hypothetical protein [Chitinivibrionales bacterium]
MVKRLTIVIAAVLAFLIMAYAQSPSNPTTWTVPNNPYDCVDPNFCWGSAPPPMTHSLTLSASRLEAYQGKTTDLYLDVTGVPTGASGIGSCGSFEEPTMYMYGYSELSVSNTGWRPPDRTAPVHGWVTVFGLKTTQADPYNQSCSPYRSPIFDENGLVGDGYTVYSIFQENIEFEQVSSNHGTFINGGNPISDRWHFRVKPNAKIGIYRLTFFFCNGTTSTCRITNSPVVDIYVLPAEQPCVGQPQWQIMSIPNLPAGSELGSIWSNSPNDVYVWSRRTNAGVTDAALFHFNGSAWSQVLTYPNTVPDALYATGPTDVFASVVSSGQALVFHSNDGGITWIQQPVPSGIGGIGKMSGTAGNVQASGGGGILRYNGSQWQKIFSDPSNPPYSLHMLSANEGYYTTCWGWGKWNGTSWQFHSNGFDFCDVSSTWGVRDESGALHLYTVGNNNFSNGIRVWKFNEATQSFGGKYAFVFADGNGANSGSAGGIWGTGPNDVYVIGQLGGMVNPNSGRVYHFNGANWQRITDFGDIYGPTAISGSGPDDVWIALFNGQILHKTIPCQSTPVANPQSLTTDEETALSMVLTGNDPGGQPLTYAVVEQPLHGTLSGTAPHLTYTPAPGFSGKDNFTFTVNNGTSTSQPAVIEITVNDVNHSPVASAGPDQTVSAGNNCLATVTLDGSGSSDQDGDNLTYTWAGPFGTVNGVTPTVDIPKGENSITLTVNDGKGGTASDNVIIIVNDNTAPIISNVPEAIKVEATGHLTAVAVPLPAVVDNCDPNPMLISDAPLEFPLGITIVTFTATDAVGLSSTAATTVTVEDKVPPIIKISGVEENGIYTDMVTANVLITDNESGVASQSIQLDGLAYMSGTAITAKGHHTLIVTATDFSNNQTILAVDFTVYHSTDLTLSTATGHYSDNVIVEATVVSHGQPLGGKQVLFSVNGVIVGTGATGSTGIAALTLPLSFPAGSYAIDAMFAQQDTPFYYRGSSAAGALMVTPETATISYNGGLLVAYPGSLQLSAVVTQEADNMPGDLSKASVRFMVYQVDAEGNHTLIENQVSGCNTSGVALIDRFYSAGVYSISASVEGYGYFTSGAVSEAVAAVYNPEGGFATGGGWINVTNLDEGNIGRANFGFIAKYKDNSATGNLEFQYNAGSINLQSKQIDWLVISSVSAQFEGLGTIKNKPGLYKFRISCTDNGGNQKTDKFTIKIWDASDDENTLIYKALNQDLAGGNILVKTK